MPAERLLPTVHPEDDDSPRYWHEVAGVPAASITRLGDNWWGPPGASGPCGPDSEIYYDRGPGYGCGEADCAPGCDRCERYLEIWNLVFMQFYQDTDGRRTPLKQQNIDTGMGLERLSMVLQGKESVFDTDLFRPILDTFATVAGTRYGADPAHDRSLRVIADHGRALVFLAADDVRPSNEGRGYVFRRILRRAVRHGKLLGIERPFLAEAADAVIEVMSEHYRELAERRDHIQEMLAVEERKFSQTLTLGSQILTRELDTLERDGASEVPGEVAFRLYGTHGFPLELTEEVARERGLRVDRPGYESALRRQQELSSGQDVFIREREEEVWTAIGKGLPPTEFTGYEGTTAASAILAILSEEQPTEEISAPQTAALVLRATPFYAEAGGQVGDQGHLIATTGTFVVRDTRRPVPGLTVHYGHVSEGHLRVGSMVRAEVDLPLRRATMRNHSATHLLHRALKEVLGDQVEQRGSLVAPDHLRFDFNHPRPVTTEEIHEIDRRVNAWVLDDLHVRTEILPYPEAVATGAMALFSEKYGETVRVVTMGPSKELCGGTHVHGTGQIGVFLTTQESSTGAGTRRIEALTGLSAETYLRGRSDLIADLADRLQTPPDRLAERLGQLQEDLAETRRQLAQVQRGQAREEAARLAAAVRETRGISYVAAVVAVPDERALRELGDEIRDRIGSGIIALGAEIDGHVSFIVTADNALTRRGLDAGKLAAALGERLGGRGGGHARSGQGGGREPQQLAAALSAFEPLITAQLS